MGMEQKKTFSDYFSEIEDPRIERTKKHKLEDIFFIAICGVICGANDWVNIEMFGKAKEDWLKEYLELPNGIPSHDTFGRVFQQIDPKEFQKRFLEWIRDVQKKTAGEVVAIDGKTIRRSHDKREGKKAIHMINAWATTNHLLLGQEKTEEKSNEITAIPELLEVLSIAGCIITLDAMGCQEDIASKIIKKEADYVLAVKENQGRLYQDLKELFDGAEKVDYQHVPHDFEKQVSKHGRIEIRRCWTISDQEYIEYIHRYQRWPALQTIALVESERIIDGKSSVERRYYISSLENNAKTFLHAVRAHWQVENSLHWVLDMSFREDDSRIRKDHGPENFAVLRAIALNLLKQENSLKRSIQGKRLFAGWRNDYLVKILFTSQ